MTRRHWGLGLVGCWLMACGGDDTASTAGATDSSTTGSGSTGVATTSGEPTTGTTGEPGSGTGTGTGETTDETTGTTAEPTSGSTTGTTGTTGDETTGDETTGDTTGPAPFCGDGNLDAREECDEGSNNSDTGTCTVTCKKTFCGDGLVGPGEGCDDGNQVDDDACTNLCASATCGDAIVQMAEACDDGNPDNTDACLSTCAAASCGDGFVQDGVEACDDGNMDDSDQCTACALPTCDDGVKNGDESDVDCGGACDNCEAGQACGDNGDCDDGVPCQQNLCSLQISCKAIKAALPALPNGFYPIDVDGPGEQEPLTVYCDQTYLGGGWIRLMSAEYPHFFNNMNWQNLNAGDPQHENYSILGKRDFFKTGITYTYRYAVGNLQSWNNGPIVFQIAWQQGHDAFTATTNGADYQYIDGNKPTTCGGFNGLHNKYSSPSYATDVDLGDNQGCWWMQVVPRDDWNKYGYSPGYLHGFLGGFNNPQGVTQWEVLYIRE